MTNHNEATPLPLSVEKNRFFVCVCVCVLVFFFFNQKIGRCCKEFTHQKIIWKRSPINNCSRS